MLNAVRIVALLALLYPQAVITAYSSGFHGSDAFLPVSFAGERSDSYHDRRRHWRRPFTSPLPSSSSIFDMDDFTSGMFPWLSMGSAGFPFDDSDDVEFGRFPRVRRLDDDGYGKVSASYATLSSLGERDGVSEGTVLTSSDDVSRPSPCCESCRRETFPEASTEELPCCSSCQEGRPVVGSLSAPASPQSVLPPMEPSIPMRSPDVFHSTPIRTTARECSASSCSGCCRPGGTCRNCRRDKRLPPPPTIQFSAPPPSRRPTPSPPTRISPPPPTPKPAPGPSRAPPPFPHQSCPSCSSQPTATPSSVPIVPPSRPCQTCPASPPVSPMQPSSQVGQTIAPDTRPVPSPIYSAPSLAPASSIPIAIPQVVAGPVSVAPTNPEPVAAEPRSALSTSSRVFEALSVPFDAPATQSARPARSSATSSLGSDQDKDALADFLSSGPRPPSYLLFTKTPPPPRIVPPAIPGLIAATGYL